MQAVATRELELVCGGFGKSSTKINVNVITVQKAYLEAEQANVNLYGKDNKQSNTAFIVQSIG